MATKNQLKLIAETGKQEMFFIREFEAPRELVFKAHSDPKIMEQWMGPCVIKTVFDKYEAKNHGSYRYTCSTQDGHSFSFNGAIHEMIAPERIIQTVEFEEYPVKGRAAIEIIRFEALPGDRTRLTSQTIFQSVDDRDGAVKSGMEAGVIEGYERLDEMLEDGKL